MPAKQNHDLEPLLTAQQNQLGLVFSDSNTIDAKALAILAANVAILIFIRQTDLGLSLWQILLTSGAFALSLLLDIFSIWPRQYIGAVAELDESGSILVLSRENLILQLLADTQAAIRHNERLNRQRLRTCITSIALTGLGFLALLLIL